ncbi:hypothetical protein [Acidovorax sp. JHL-9]|uniref:hypothetical protein n=1 Tax=Acidovorax sp. JHL-9 TaxID=1276756 RepID=UPI000684BCAB|nr:hypothetical protein [Acidovorax sp. JHL-9]
MAMDATGITDLRQEAPHTAPWETMEHVHLDNQDNVILVKLRQDPACAEKSTSTALRRSSRGCFHGLSALSRSTFYGAMPPGPPITHSHQEIPCKSFFP